MTIRVLALVPYPLRWAPGQRYRIEQWAPHLASQGIAVTFEPFLSRAGMDVVYSPGHTVGKAREVGSAWVRRLRSGFGQGRFDAVYVYREAGMLGASWFERSLARRLPLVYDFDDAIYLPAVSTWNRSLAFLKSPRKTERICRAAAHVTVGNETLAGVARQWAARVTVIPSSIDTDEYRVVPRPANTKPVVGWTGSPPTSIYLADLAPALRALRERVDFRLRVIGARLPLPGLDVDTRDWRPETEVEDLRDIDVGLMPLTDDAWARAKCGMKALQYMGLGIPPVVSPVGTNTEIVTDGVSGFYASSHAEWTNRIETLLKDAALARRMGAAGREVVETRFSAALQAGRLADVIRSVVRRPGSPAHP